MPNILSSGSKTPTSLCKNILILRSLPYSSGPAKLPFQRPAEQCRTFTSEAVEKVIKDMTSRMKDPDLARLFENAMPNTLDTTVAWHKDGTAEQHIELKPKRGIPARSNWDGPQSFIVTGDINACWIRDSTNQVRPYMALASKDSKIFNLILGLINTQVEMVIQSPYCNAFQPPPVSHLPPSQNGFDDIIHPITEPSVVFECKYELDSLGNFLALSNSFYEHTESAQYLTPRWYQALENVLDVIDQQSQSTFNPTTGAFRKNEYIFRRQTNQGTETLPLSGVGNPFANDTGLVRSAFRPSDDATILPLLIPSNAMMAVELKRTAKVLRKAGKSVLAQNLEKISERISSGVWEYGVFKHKVFGEVFAYEVDGYSSHITMDDANLPSLLSLPLLGFLEVDDPVYQNTRKMLLSKTSNPYYLQGPEFKGIGGAHIGFEHAWPMSLLVQIYTSSDDNEINQCLGLVLNSSQLGLVHESVHVDHMKDWTRGWFSWANSLLAEVFLDLARRKPHILFGEGAQPFVIE